MKKQEKVIIFSHENDIDGLGNIILGKIAFGEIEVYWHQMSIYLKQNLGITWKKGYYIIMIEFL